MGISRKQSTANFPKNRHFLPPDTAGKKFSFFGKFAVLCFLEIPALRYALLPYCRRTQEDFVGSAFLCNA